MVKSDKIILRKISDEIFVINNIVGDLTFEDFVAGEEKKRSVAMTLINIGELGSNLKKKYPEYSDVLPLRKMIDLRNIVAHEYQKIEFAQIWKLIKNELQELKNAIEKLL